jgi:hypothetical protein
MAQSRWQDRKEMAVGIVVAIGVLVTMYFYLAGSTSLSFEKVILVAIVFVLVGLAMIVLWDRVTNLRKGFVAKDERLVNINYKAGYYAFIAAIWSAIGGPFIYETMNGQELPGGAVTAIVIIVGGFTFVISYLYLQRKGD